MSDARSDALVFFGATGDLAYKKIFPAQQANAGWRTLEKLQARSTLPLIPEEQHESALRR